MRFIFEHMFCHTRSSLFRAHGSTFGRSFGSKSRSSSRPRAAARRAALATDRRIQRADNGGSASRTTATAVDSGEQILSESGMKWGFFFSLGVFPIIAFSVAVATTPHLRQQLDELLGWQAQDNNSTANNNDNKADPTQGTETSQ